MQRSSLLRYLLDHKEEDRYTKSDVDRLLVGEQ